MTTDSTQTPTTTLPATSSSTDRPEAGNVNSTSGPGPGEGLSPLTRFGAVAVVATFLIFHLFAIGLHAGPINPIKLQTSEVVNSYVGNTLVQTWTLFAPTPMNDERGVLVRAQRRDAVTGQITTTEWVDVSTPVIARSQRTRYFAPRESRILLNLSGMVNWRDPYAQRFRERLEEMALTTTESPQRDSIGGADTQPTDSRAPDLAFISPMEESFQEDSLSMFARYSILKAQDLWGDDLDAVQVRFVVHKFPPFSQRHSEDIGEVVPVDLGWFNVREFMTQEMEHQQ